jgi:hypothetical protein
MVLAASSLLPLATGEIIENWVLLFAPDKLSVAPPPQAANISVKK